MIFDWFRSKRSEPPADSEPQAGHGPREAAEELVAFYLPPLLTILVSERDNKGAELTEAEVLAVREKSICMVMPRTRAQALVDKRGFADLDPNNVWAEWQAFVTEHRRAVAS